MYEKRKKESTKYAGRKDRHKAETEKIRETKEANRSCQKDGQQGDERSVKEKMKKQAAAAMGIVILAALLGGCASNTANEAKSGSTAETKNTESKETQKNTELPNSGQSDIEETGSAQTVSDSDGQQTSDTKETEQTSEAQDSETSGGQAEFTSGTYVGDGESITLTDEDGVLNFSFAQAGITGTATPDGDAAIYSGDDDHQIEFRQDGTILTVTVTGAQGEESASPLAGTYVKEAD